MLKMIYSWILVFRQKKKRVKKHSTVLKKKSVFYS